MIESIVQNAARAFELAGILAMAAGAVAAFVRYAGSRDYHALRRHLARAILLGLELLIAADIIATIVVRPDLVSVAALGLIVLIRTFLSFTLELEATGRFPWQREQDSEPPAT